MSDAKSLDFPGFVLIIVGALEEAGTPYMIGGALAVWAWGEPRLTLDLDVVVHLREEHLDPLAEALYRHEIYSPADIMRDLIRDTRSDLPINAIHGFSGYKAELFPLRRGDALRESALARRRQFDFGEQLGVLYVHAPEDLILYKLHYYSISRQTKHIRDIGSILARKDVALDRAYLDGWIDRKGLRAVWQEILSAT